jgi:predicted CoA-binding protein
MPKWAEVEQISIAALENVSVLWMQLKLTNKRRDMCYDHNYQQIILDLKKSEK